MELKPQPLLLAATITLLTVCGGGSDDNSPADPRPDNPGNTGKILQPAPGNNVPEIYRQRLHEVKTKDLGVSSGGARIDTILDGRTLTSLANNRLKMNLLSLPQGWLDKTGTSVRSGWGGDTESARIRSYNGFYGGAYIQQSEHGLNLKAAYGIEPLAGEIPTSGKATYTGVAFDKDDRGTLSYHVDFGSKQGHGNITNLGRYGNVTLQPATFRQVNEADYVIYEIPQRVGVASSDRYGRMSYDLRLWGPQAAELSGKLSNTDEAVAVFHGTRGAITE